jgi:uncharacterized membrane protein
MSNEDRNSNPTEPSAGESWTLDSAARGSESPEERLTRELNETAQGLTSDLKDLEDELAQPGMRDDEFAVGAYATESSGTTPVDLPRPSPVDSGMSATEDAPAVVPPSLQGSGTGARPPKGTDTPEGSDDDRLMSALAWLSMVILQLPIVSVIQLMSPNNRERSFQRHHAVTSLLFFAAAIVYEIIAGIAFTILTIVTAGCGAFCLWIIFLVPHMLGLYYAYQAYMGKRVELPGLSDFGRNQGWM